MTESHVPMTTASSWQSENRSDEESIMVMSLLSSLGKINFMFSVVVA
jgi:hypothetical protein